MAFALPDVVSAVVLASGSAVACVVAACAALERVAPIMEEATRAPPRGRTRRLARGFNLAPSASWDHSRVMDHSRRNPHMSKETRGDRTRQRWVKKLQIGHRLGPI